MSDPEPSASGSATGNPRNKVALKQGHSLMDWIRLGNSGTDLTGTGGKILKVTKEELAKHHSEKDAWIAIRGNVYNITRYLDFHPGGVSELMRGAGIDGTELFNKVHPWVNFESLLAKCLVGRLVGGNDFLTPTAVFSPSPAPPPSPSISSAPSLPPALSKVDWYQQASFVSVVLYLREPEIERLHLNCKCDKELWLYINGYWVGWKLACDIQWPPQVSLPNPLKVEIRLNKEGPLWNDLPACKSVVKPPPSKYSQVSVKSIQQVNYNVHTVEMSYVDKIMEFVPLGWHQTFKANIKGSPVERQYTPITGSILTQSSNCDITLMVKAYPDGVFSSWLTTRKVNDVLSAGFPVGSFSTSSLSKSSHLVMIAAGTGITPMLRLMSWTLQPSKKIAAKLLFFNKAEKDIIWKQQLSLLMSTNSRFTVEHILSDADSSWKGKRGWVTLQLLQEVLPDFSNSVPLPYFVCICGPIAFTQLTERYLNDMGYSSDHYFCFR
uniref:Cytochrome b5 reductase 4 n=1 Tax=Lygus hesperus TaxID=30085 RepID=A0A0A9VV35_LYGHE